MKAVPILTLLAVGAIFLAAILYEPQDEDSCDFIMREADKKSKLWVAGNTIEDAVRVARELNSQNILAILNHIGEHYKDVEHADAEVDEYLKLLDRIHNEGLDAVISLKPTQIGLDISKDAFEMRLRKIMKRADAYHIRVTTDLESSAYYKDTMEVFMKLLREGYSGMRVALQAARKDIIPTLEEISKLGGSARLCKGAYKENSELFYSDPKEVGQSLVKAVEKSLTWGTSALGSKDMSIVNLFLGKGLEFQTLFGFVPELKSYLLERNERVAEYVPYGPTWYEYCTRRDPWFFKMAKCM